MQAMLMNDAGKTDGIAGKIILTME